MAITHEIQNTLRRPGEGDIILKDRRMEKAKESSKKMKKKGKLSKEILVIFIISILAAVCTYFFFRSTAGSYVFDYCEKKKIILDELQNIQLDYLIEFGSLLTSVLMFLLLFLFLLGRKLSYLQVISEGIEALRIHRMDYKIPIKGNNELTDLAHRINYLSRTEKELSEKEKQLKKERELLIRALSHDIRTPLTSIRSYSEMMEKKLGEEVVDREEIRDYVELMIKKADQMKDLSGQLLENCKHNPERIEDGKLLMEQLAWEWEEQLEDRFDVRIDVAGCPAFSGEIDVREFQRVFDNLYSNVLKYAEESIPVELIIGETEGRLSIFQKNKKKKDISHVESHQIGLLSIKAIAGNYGGNVEVKEDEDSYEIRILLLKI